MIASTVLAAALLLQLSSEEPKGSLSGRVVCAETGEGLRGVNVFLSSQTPNQRFGRNSASAADGSFTFDRLPGGAYSLAMHKPGYFAAMIIPLRVTLEPNQARTGFDLKMHRPGVIAGTVTDTDSLPMANAQVTAFKVEWVDGRRRATPVAKARVDDRGRYRLFGLEAGRYLIGAKAPAEEAPDGELELTLRTFYPVASRLAEASPVVVRWGQEASGISLVLRPQPSFTVTGRILDAAAGRPCQACVISARQVDELSEPEGPSTRAAADGTYRIRGLMPGLYRLSVEKTKPPNTSATRTVQVTNRHLRDFDLVVGLERLVSGRVTFDSPPSNLESGKLNLKLVLGAEDGEEETARVGNDMAFSLRGLQQGSYRVQLEGLPAGGYLKTLKLAGRELASPAIELPEQGGLSQLEALVAFDAASLSGSVKSDRPEQVSGATIVLLPQDNQSPYLMELRTNTDRSGGFVVSGIPPGNYTAFALPPAGAPELADPETRRRFQNYGRSFAFSRGQKATTELAPVPASEEQ